MSNRSKKQKSTPAQERLLQSLLRQHKELGEQIIALVLQTNTETERWMQSLAPSRKARLLEFPSLTEETQKQ